MAAETRIQGVCKEVLEKTEWVGIVTWSGGSPHLAATWGDYVRSFGIIDGEILLVPAGRYRRTEENLRKNRDIQMLIASRQVKRDSGQGQGCVIFGEAEVQTEGEFAQRVTEKFRWARGALVIRIKEVKTQL